MAKRVAKHAKKSHKKGKTSKAQLMGRGAAANLVKPFLTGLFDKAIDKIKPGLDKTGKIEYSKRMGSKLDAEFRPSNIIDKGVDMKAIKDWAWNNYGVTNAIVDSTVGDIKQGFVDAFKEYGFGYKKKGKKRASRK